MEDEKVKGREKVGESVTINWEINKKKKKCVCVCVLDIGVDDMIANVPQRNVTTINIMI